MKFKVGDKVKVKSLSWYNSNKNHYGFVNDDNCSEPFSDKMAEYCGKTAIVIGIYNDSYDLDIDNKEWGWYDWMLEDEPTVSDQLKEKRFQAACHAMQGLCVGKITADIKKGQCSDIAEISYLLADELLKQGGYTEQNQTI